MIPSRPKEAISGGEVSIEVRSGAAHFDVAVQAETIQRAMSFVKERNSKGTLKVRPRVAHDACCSLDSLEGLLKVQDHIPSVLDTNRESHEVLPDPEPLSPRRRELAVRGGGRMDGKGIDVS
jgi:hypothetical protein